MIEEMVAFGSTFLIRLRFGSFSGLYVWVRRFLHMLLVALRYAWTVILLSTGSSA